MEASGQATAITVSQLNRRVKALLEKGLARLWIEGELSNIARPASGHLYFTLKDDSAQIRAAFFRGRQRGGSTTGFKNGDKVLAFGQVRKKSSTPKACSTRTTNARYPSCRHVSA